MRLRHRLALVCVSASALVPFIATPSAHAAACVGSSRTMSGTIGGQDGRAVDVLLGFDILDRSGRRLDARPGLTTWGCPYSGGYSNTIRINRDLPATGSTSTGTKTFKVTVPANATQMFIEAYPSAAGYGGTDESRYGHALRSQMPLPYNASITIRLPLVCAAGGVAGQIHGYTTYRGVRTKADRVAAWSMAHDNNYARPILGWTVGITYSNGYYRLPNLASGQPYVVRVTMKGVTKQYTNVYVNNCRSTMLGSSF